MRITGTIELDGLYVVFNQGTSTQTTLQAVAPASNIVLSLPNTADTLAGIAATQTLTNKTINAANNTISNLTVAMLAAGVLNTSATLTGATDSQVPSALATKTYADNAVVSGLAAKADKTTTISAGTGLTGGGDLSANRTIALADTAVTLGSYGSATQVATFTVDQQGRLTAASNTSIQIAQSQVTNLVTDLAGKQAADVDLDALAALSTTGLIARTGAGTAATRTITQPAAGITVTDGDGVAGNPTLALANDLSALEGLSGTGIAVRTAADTWAQRTITAGTGISVTDGNGVAGNPTVAIDSTVATLSGTQVLTNKDYDGGTASNSRRLTVPKDTYTNLLALTRKEGTLLYATDQDILYSDDGTNLNAVGSGSGSGTGSLNIVDNPSATSATTGWTAATDYTVTRNTTDSPLEGVIDTCFAISTSAASSESSTSGVYAASLAMPPALRNSKVQCSLWVTVPATADGVWRLSVYNSGGTRMTLNRDSSSVFTLPGGYTGELPFTFDAADSATYTISFTQTTQTNANTLYATLISIGNGQIGSVPAVGNWQSWTPTGTWTTNTTYTGRYSRVGQRLIGRVGITLTGAPGGTSQLGVNLPSGLTLDTTAILALGRAESLAKIHVYRNGNYFSTGTCEYDATVSNVTLKGRFQIQDPAGTSNSIATITATSPSSWANLDYLMIEIDVPIAEWAGSVSTGPVPAEEFAYTSGSFDSPSSTTAFGPGGQATTALTNDRIKTITWQYPIQQDDEIIVEGSRDGVTWAPMDGFLFSVGPVVRGVDSGGGYSGFSHYNTSTQTLVTFYANMNRANDDSPSIGWPASGGYWRVRKTKKASLPFANAGTDGSAGLYKAGQAPGQITGATIASGYVGEVKTWTSAPSTQVLTTSTADWTNASITLTPGVWQISANITVQVATGTSAADNTTCVAYVTDSANTVIQNMESGLAVTTSATASTLVASMLSFSAIVNINTSTTYKIRGIRIDGAGTGSAQLRNQGASYSRFYAVRIA